MTTTLDRKVAVTQALADRQRLLSLGYTPLPSRGKLCLLPGWPSVQPDDAMLAKWARNMELCSSGIRLTGQQIAIDLDVLDADLVGELLDKLFERWPALDDAPERVGRAPKVLYLAQLAEGEAPLTAMSTKRWKNPQGDLEHVEVFGGGRARFIGWCGPHTLEDRPGPDGWIVHRTYSDAEMPICPVDQLPVITMVTLRAWLADCDKVFEAAGYIEHRQQAGATSSFVRDLSEDMTFLCDDGIVREGIEAMVTYAGLDDHARCALSFLDPNADNTTRCRVSLSDDGELRIFDFGDWVTHAPVGGAAVTPPVDLSSLGAALASLPKTTVQELEPVGSLVDTPTVGAAEQAYIDAGGDLGQWLEDDVQSAAERFQAAYDELMHGMVYDTTEEVCRRVDQSPEIGMTIARRKDSYANSSLIVVGPKGGRKTVNPLTAWAASRKRWEVAGVRFMPDAPSIFGEEGRQWLNLWRESEVDAQLIDPEAMTAWFKLMNHLIPDEREREWFERFIAHKLVNPRFRGAAVLMVAASVQGAGRSTLMAILYDVFGGYAASISSAHLFDSNQRNGWMERALWAFGNEVRFSTKYSDRVQAYERLKDLIDPAQSRVRLDEKYQRPREATIFTTFLLATNRHDALPLSVDDRRVFVITNGGAMPAELKDELYGQWFVEGKPAPALVHTLRAYLRARGEEVLAQGDTADLVDAPKWSSGRDEMIEAGESDVDAVFRQAIERIPSGQMAIKREDLEKLLLGELRVQGMEAKRTAIRPFINGLRGAEAVKWGWELLHGRVKVGVSGNNVAVLARPKLTREFMELTPKERAEVSTQAGAVTLATAVG
jgi:hypothetical protein